MLTMADLLVVEDDPDAADLLTRLLETGGHRIRQAANGQKALEEALARTPDLVLLDLAMPQMDGPSLLQILRSYLRWHALPVLIVTALPANDPTLLRAQGLGVSGTFYKGGYRPSDLLDRINELTAPAKGAGKSMA
jgi:CheY-like chemotaxis protein